MNTTAGPFQTVFSECIKQGIIPIVRAHLTLGFIQLTILIHKLVKT